MGFNTAQKIKLPNSRPTTMLGVLRAQHQEIYPYDVRIMDKLLWMLGNPR